MGYRDNIERVCARLPDRAAVDAATARATATPRRLRAEARLADQDVWVYRDTATCEARALPSKAVRSLGAAVAFELAADDAPAA